MAITCDGCGMCCLGQNLVPLSCNYLDGVYLPNDLCVPLKRILEAQEKHRDPGETACVWFDWATCRCRHYEYRPSVCRKLNVGDEACLAMREAAGLTVP